MTGIYFDTNILFYGTPLLLHDDFLKLKNNNCKILISEIVSLEGKDRNYRIILERFESLSKVINDEKTDLYFNTKESIKPDFDLAYKKSNERIDTFIQHEMEAEIVLNPFKDNALEILFERYHSKQPPFASDPKASDKGWKDTLIWLSLIEYAKTSELDEFLFVSNDSAFSKYKQSLIEEFKEKTGKKVDIIEINDNHDLLKFLGIEKEKAKSDSKGISEETIKFIKQSIREVMTLYTQKGEIDPRPPFRFFNNVTIEQCERFCDEILKCGDDYLFEDRINIEPILEKCFGDCHVIGVLTPKEFNNFRKCWADIKENYQDKKNAFLTAIKDEFNKMVSHSYIDDLPF